MYPLRKAPLKMCFFLSWDIMLAPQKKLIPQTKVPHESKLYGAVSLLRGVTWDYSTNASKIKGKYLSYPAQTKKLVV